MERQSKARTQRGAIPAGWAAGWAPGRAVAFALGFAALWVCLQASGFYPLSLVRNVEGVPVRTVALLHLAYCVFVVILAVAAATSARLRALMRPSSILAIAASCSAGVVGHALLLFVAPGISAFAWLAVVGCILVAVFIVGMTVLWGSAMADSPGYGVYPMTFASFLLAQAVQVLYYGLSLPKAPLFLLAPLACGAGLVVFLRASRSDARDGAPRAAAPEDSGPARAALRDLPWSMLAPALFFVYFTVVFVRLRIPGFMGDSAVTSKADTAAFALVVMLVASAVALRRQFSGRATIELFALLSIIAIMTMAAVLVTYDAAFATGSGWFRRLIGVEHCFEAFIWVVLLHSVRVRGVDGARAGALYLILIVAVVWVLSFDLYYLAGLDQVLPSVSLLVPGMTAALVIVAAGVILYLLALSLRAGGARPAPSADELISSAVDAAIAGAGLTASERSVALMLYRGHSAKRIAGELSLSESTVKTYTSRLYHKLGVASKQEYISLVESRSRHEG